MFSSYTTITTHDKDKEIWSKTKMTPSVIPCPPTLVKSINSSRSSGFSRSSVHPRSKKVVNIHNRSDSSDLHKILNNSLLFPPLKNCTRASDDVSPLSSRSRPRPNTTYNNPDDSDDSSLGSVGMLNELKSDFILMSPEELGDRHLHHLNKKDDEDGKDENSNNSTYLIISPNRRDNGQNKRRRNNGQNKRRRVTEIAIRNDLYPSSRLHRRTFLKPKSRFYHRN
mmetsp:Transcript_5477/g.6988  ORF Transcript_5477/g.6988 Transcript_5477/m.6988 type:complete len:225 (+) Transcript_5477:98-772(+)